MEPDPDSWASFLKSPHDTIRPDAACMGGECAIAAFMGLSFAVENALHTRLYGGFHLGG